MRAVYPDREGTVERNGANVAFEVYERPGAPTLLLTQTWQIIHSRHWKFMIPYLSRHYRVVTYDPVGNGRSDRSLDRERYGRREQLDDALAVLDATGTATAIAIGLSLGGGLATLLGVLHPERIDGVVAIAPSHRWAVPHQDREASFARMFDPVENPQGWEKYNVHYWRENWADFVEFFFAECCSDPHSTKLWDDTTGWAMETDGELIALGEEAAPIDVPDIEAALLAMRQPMLIIHGTGDRIVSYKSALELQRRIPHAQLMTMDGVGHLPTGRYPVRINHAIKAFADQTYGRTGTTVDPAPSPPPSRHTRREAPRPGAHDLVTHRSRPCSARRRDLSGAPPAPTRARDRVAGAGSGDESAGERRRDDSPCVGIDGKRVGPHRIGMWRARPRRLPDAA